MNKLLVNTDSKTYPIYFTKDFSYLSQAIVGIDKSYSNFVIITDSNVRPLYEEMISIELNKLNKDYCFIDFEAGESNKTLDTISGFYEKMIEFGADRKTLVIALGGGVTGDMAGFTAATYMRGVDFVQVPTTLLSQVDSSVGGKTGVDFNGYKNIVGAFYQPEFVFINVNTLKTLPVREVNAGMGEVIKHGIIRDKEYFEFLTASVDAIKALDEETMQKVIRRSCEIKKSVVDQDEKEHGLRALLNFGHTFGHSIERLKGFELVHGECVAIGMHCALLLSNKLGLIEPETTKECLELIKAVDLPITVNGLNPSDVYDNMFKDKKTSGNRLVFALIYAIGDGRLSRDIIDKNIIMECLEEIC